MVISRGTGFTLPQQAAAVLTPSDGNGEFGIALSTALIIGASTLLGGGTIWQFNKKREERSDYIDCLETYTTPPYSMAPQEAAIMCGGDVPGRFKFGLNAQTFILVAASVFGMWFVTQVLMTAVKSKIGGKK